MSVLDPMLFLGGFYLPPFHVKSEQSVEITTEDEVIVTGSMDVLVLKNSCGFFGQSCVFRRSRTGTNPVLYAGKSCSRSAMLCMIATGGSFIFQVLKSTAVCNL